MDSAAFASRGRLFQCMAPLQLKHLLPNSFFGIGSAKSVFLFLRLYVLLLSVLNRNVSLRLGAVWPFRIL